tara:strand:- start:4 stop:879 length:876 start_codon:yes stop_codon:yes gene_type:complete
MKPNLVTICGHNTTMLKHMLNHYKDMVKDIFVVVYLSSDKDRVLSEVKEITDELNLDIHKTTIEEPFNWERVTKLYNQTKMLRPHDWWIVSDDDELQVYNERKHLGKILGIEDIIEECEDRGNTYVCGAFLDRIGEGGKFPRITHDSNIWKEFPLAGSFRVHASQACPNKVCLMKGYVEVTNGQHYVKINGKDTYGDRWKHRQRYDDRNCFVQVNHFKWDLSVLTRLKEVVNIKKPYTYHEEYKRMFDYILDNNMKINIDDDRFMIERCGKHYGDYLQWEKIKAQAKAYRI